MKQLAAGRVFDPSGDGFQQRQVNLGRPNFRREGISKPIINESLFFDFSVYFLRGSHGRGVPGADFS